MSIVLGFPQLERIPELGLPSDESVRRQVWEILARLYPPGKTTERRIDQRFPYPHLLYLTPVANDSLTPVGESVVVVGKHLSEHGLGFFYQQPMPVPPHDRLTRAAGFAVDGVLDRHHLVPLHATRLVR